MLLYIIDYPAKKPFEDQIKAEHLLIFGNYSNQLTMGTCIQFQGREDNLLYICWTSVLTNTWPDWLGLFYSEDQKHSNGMRSGLCFLRALGEADDICKTPNGCLKSRNWNEIKSDQYWNSKVKSVHQWIRQNTSWQTDLTAIGIGNHLCWIDAEVAK